jgi:hypothetical protein
VLKVLQSRTKFFKFDEQTQGVISGTQMADRIAGFLGYPINTDFYIYPLSGEYRTTSLNNFSGNVLWIHVLYFTTDGYS